MNDEQEIAQLKANNNRLRLAALNAISFMSGGDAKAELRDAYDETPEESLIEHDIQVINDAIESINGYVTVSQVPHSQYAAGWNAAIKGIKDYARKHRRDSYEQI